MCSLRFNTVGFSSDELSTANGSRFNHEYEATEATEIQRQNREIWCPMQNYLKEEISFLCLVIALGKPPEDVIYVSH